MSTLSLRIPDSIHKKMKEISEKEHVSINQFIASALSEKLSAYLTEEYINKRAEYGSREKFDNALKMISDRVPLDSDKIE